MLVIPVLLLLRTPSVASTAAQSGGRPLKAILMSPRYMLAVATGVVSYGLMTFVMTASPVAMVGHGHQITQITEVHGCGNSSSRARQRG
mgnify:CR=1 FL=1